MIRLRFKALTFQALCIFATLGSAAQEGTTFYGGFPYPVPPDGHFNTFATNAINFYSFYSDLLEPPLCVYK